MGEHMKKKVYLIISLVALLMLVIGLSYAFFSAVITQNPSNMVGNAANLELTFTDGNGTISGSYITPGWTGSDTFTITNTGSDTTNYVIRFTNITNTFSVYGSITYDLSCNNGVSLSNKVLPTASGVVVTGPISINVNAIHSCTISASYEDISGVDQLVDSGANFSFTVEIEGVNVKEISYVEDLVDLSKNVNSGTSYAHTWFVLQDDLDFSNSTSYRNSSDTSYGDINGNGTVETIFNELTSTASGAKGFMPIGSSTNHFKGSFDGNGHAIDSLYINRSDTDAALFGYVEGSTIRNLNIIGYVNGGGTNAVAGLVAKTSGNTNIIECSITVNVSNSGSGSTGGIVGLNTGNLYIAKSGTDSVIISGGDYVGGIIGRSVSTNGEKAIVEACYNNGNIVSSNNNSRIGGLVGAGDLIDILVGYNSGDVSGTHGVAAGGLIGSAGTVNIYGSMNGGDVSLNSSTGSTPGALGGLVGSIHDGKIVSNYVNGEISGSYVASSGGIVGRKELSESSLLIDHCVRSNSSTVGENGISGQTVSVGGLVGSSLADSTHLGPLIITNSFTNSDVGAVDVAGGLVGLSNSDTYIINSAFLGGISSSDSGSGIVGLVQSRNLYLNNVYSGTSNLPDNSGSSFGLFKINSGATSNVTNAYYVHNEDSFPGSNNSDGTEITASYMASAQFASTLNSNKDDIDLATAYNGVIPTISLNDWQLIEGNVVMDFPLGFVYDYVPPAFGD